MLAKVADIAVMSGHRIRVTFVDGRTGVHDFSGLVAEAGSQLLPLRDPAYFERVFLDSGALTWPNGFDVAPEWLLQEMVAAGELGAVAPAVSS